VKAKWLIGCLLLNLFKTLAHILGERLIMIIFFLVGIEAEITILVALRKNEVCRTTYSCPAVAQTNKILLIQFGSLIPGYLRIIFGGSFDSGLNYPL